MSSLPPLPGEADPKPLRYAVRKQRLCGLVFLQEGNQIYSEAISKDRDTRWPIDLSTGLSCTLTVRECNSPRSKAKFPINAPVGAENASFARLFLLDTDAVGPLLRRDYGVQPSPHSIRSHVAPVSASLSLLLDDILRAVRGNGRRALVAEYFISECAHLIATEGLGLASQRMGTRNLLLPQIHALDRYMQRHSGDVSLEDMAAICELGPRQFLRAFRNTFGTTPMQFEQKVRLIRARKLLQEPRRALAHIAVDTGFHDQAHFTNAFRRAFGQTPGQYRQAARKQYEKNARQI
ncbi:helix-turn-helix domain-containing protein [Thalassococcus sp. S3]|uniref:helix-turn-helix domain-containing protein n=1 Tax=Thalassococcus sp. S3 TaxID=2017482 RepID=UPI0013EE9DEB|nr:AraC family transcriptional regulator [Thalassococcus sp. S3]